MKAIHFENLAHHLLEAAKSLILTIHPKDKVDELLPKLGEAVKAKADEVLGKIEDSAKK